MSAVSALAKEYGFAACFALPPEPFVHYMRRLKDGALHRAGARLCADPGADYPWANALLLLIMPYRPYAPSCGVSGYYVATNAAYHAAAKLCEALAERVIRAQRVYVPVRELLVRSGLGLPLQNGLTAMPLFGTRFVVQTLAASLPAPDFACPFPASASNCASYGACARACPVGAIDESGFHFNRCARAYMDGETMPKWVMDAMTAMLGCELCQLACPHNAGLGGETELPAAFDLDRLLSGDLAEAAALIGKNMNKNQRLIQHAAVMAGKRGRTDLLPALFRLRTSEHEAVRAAAEYAICLLSKT